MNPRDLIPSSEQIKTIQGIEGQLQDRRRKGKIGFFIAVGGILLQVVLGILGNEKYVGLLQKFFTGTLRWSWHWLITPQAILLYIIFLGFAVFLIYRRTSFLVRESKEPFQYTFWIDKFEPAGERPKEAALTDTDRRLGLLHHDLMERLNERIKRLWLLNEKDLAAAGNLKVSHIQIGGHYAVRELTDREFVIHVMPRVRVGPASYPATLAYADKYPIGSSADVRLSADNYNQIVERVYSSIATEVYKRIEADISEKLELFPTNYLRGVALYHEAEDFARSNTIDAYDSAIGLYKEARRYLSLAIVKRLTRFLLVIPFFWRLRLKSKHMEANVEIGYAKCLIFRRQISAITGRSINPLYEIIGTLEREIESLGGIHNKMVAIRERRKSLFSITSLTITPLDKLIAAIDSDRESVRKIQRRLAAIKARQQGGFIMAFLTFPRDSLVRLMLLRPRERLFERQRRILFDAYVVAALAYFNLDAIPKAQEYLEEARTVDPALSEKSALFTLVAAELEADIDNAIILFRQATDMAPKFQIAQHRLAYFSQMRFRARGELDEARSRSVIEEYRRALLINPGNIAALAAQGYINWLLADPDQPEKAQEYLKKAERKFIDGREIKAIVRETFIGELTYGLARIAADRGDFDDSYDLYAQAFESDPGIAVWSSTASRKPLTSYYENISASVLLRYQKFAEGVEREAKKRKADPANTISAGILNAVSSYALNDYGNACWNYYFRLGDGSKSQIAIRQFAKAIEAYPDNLAAKYNLSIAYSWIGWTDFQSDVLKFQREISNRIPSWQDAVVKYCQSLVRVPREEIKKISETVESVRKEIQTKTDEIEKLESQINEQKASLQALLSMKEMLLAKYEDWKSKWAFDKLEQYSPAASFTPAGPDYAYLDPQIQERKNQIKSLSEAKTTAENQRESSQQKLQGLNENLLAAVRDLGDKGATAISNIIRDTKLTALFRDYTPDYAGAKVEELLSNKAIRWELLDEDDVKAMKAWAEILANNETEKTALQAGINICNHLLEKYEPSDFDVNLVLQESFARLESLDTQVPQTEKIEAAKEQIRPTIDWWLRHDPVHWGVLEWYELYFEPKRYAQMRDRAWALMEGNDDYRRTIVAPYVTRMKDALADEKFEEAREHLQTALKLGPKQARFYADLASSWENFNGDKRIEFNELALQCLTKAIEIEANNEEYQGRIADLENTKTIAGYLGQRILDKQFLLAPIVIEIANNLDPDFAGGKELLVPVRSSLEDMRARIKRTRGILTPGVILRGTSGSLTDGRYVIRIFEIPVAEGSIPRGEKLFPGSHHALKALGITGTETTKPGTHKPAVWISDADAQKVVKLGYQVWGNVEYILKHLESVLHHHLSDFFGLEEVSQLLKESLGDGAASICDSPAELTAFTAVLKRLVDEKVPITALSAMAENFQQRRKSGKSVLQIAESIRKLPEIRSQLAGNDRAFHFYTTGPKLLQEVELAIDRNSSPPILSISPPHYRRFLEAVRPWFTTQENVALLVEKPELRPFIRKLCEALYPALPVLDRSELMPGLEPNIKGEIEIAVPRT